MFSAENAEMSYACDQQAEIDRLREVNKELLTALEQIADTGDMQIAEESKGAKVGMRAYEFRAIARAAIAKATQ